MQKFDSDTERRFSVILERDALKWFKPAKGQFKIYYRDSAEHPEYVPDFVAETSHSVLMVETKSQAEMTDSKVQAKAEAATKWCQNASDYLLKNGGKAWLFLQIEWRGKISQPFSGSAMRAYLLPKIQHLMLDQVLT